MLLPNLTISYITNRNLKSHYHFFLSRSLYHHGFFLSCYFSFVHRFLRPPVVDLLFIVTCMHQKVKTLFCCINFDNKTNLVEKCFVFLSIFLVLSIYIKRKTHSILGCASKVTLTSI